MSMPSIDPPPKQSKQVLPFVAFVATIFLGVGFLVFNVLGPKDVEDLPRADAGYVEVSKTNQGRPIDVPDPVKPSDGGYILTPDLSLRITSVGEVPSLENREGVQNQPAQGYKFVVVDLIEQGSRDPMTGVSGEGTTFALDFNGTRTRLGSVTGALQYRTQIVASVPDDDSARLVVTFADYDQFFSLSTGDRTADPVTDSLYRANRLVEHTAVATPPVTFSAGGFYFYRDWESQAATYQVDRSIALLTPYSTNIGWAPAGTMWLVFEFQDSLDFPPGLYTPPILGQGQTTIHRTLSVTADGAPATQMIDGVDSTPSVGTGWGYGDVKVTVFSVPNTTQNVSVAITADPTFRSTYGAPDTTVEFPPLTIDSTFPL